HPTWPQVRQIRKCSHTLPVLRHSSHPNALGVTVWIPARWVQPFFAIASTSLRYCLSMISSENRPPLCANAALRVQIMLYNAGFAASPRKPCNAATTCAPSPIAPPTRLTDPERTSPTANTPATEGSNAGVDCPALFLHRAPLTTNPPRSSMTPQPPSQPVAGSAPTNRNKLRISAVLSSPDRRLRQRTRSRD